MLQRPYHDSEFEVLHQENSILRDRLRKMSEIEPYVQILLQNNKQYQHQINQFQTQNHRLRCKIDQVTQESLRLKESHNSQTSILKNNFQSDIDKLVRELKDILRDKDSMQNQNQLMIEQLQTKYRRDIETRRLQSEEQQREFHTRIGKMGELLRESQLILQERIWQFANKQSDLIRDIQKIAGERNTLLKDKALFEQQVAIIGSQKEILYKKNKQLQKGNEQLSNKWLKSEQQKNESILQLRDANKSLVHSNQALGNQFRIHQKTINEQNRRIGNLTIQCEQICKKNNQLQANIRRVIRAKNDLESEHRQIIQKLEVLNRTTSIQIEHKSKQIEKLLEQTKRIYKQNSNFDSDCKDKNVEIGDLLRAVEKLESRLVQISSKHSKLQSENTKLVALVKNLEQNLEEMMLQNKSFSQKISLYTKHNETLEKMLQKEKRKNISLETSRFQMQNIAIGAINKPEEICKEYQREIQKLVQQFVQQRKIGQSKNITEISKLKALYDNALRDKQDYFNHKIAYLEKELNELRRIN